MTRMQTERRHMCEHCREPATIRVDEVPGLASFMGDYFASHLPGLAWLRVFEDEVDGHAFESTRMVVPLTVPAGRDLLVRWLLEGERCCTRPPGCTECDGSGYTRKPVPHAAEFRDIPEALAENVRLVARGEDCGPA